ncbi:L,D-transpeptidase family protein [Parabacteroides goldsteinii]|uniref:L,D-transpeptidase family protein n=1 Tax=Parabacteroides goldsteinii TaxID=328812 RepID=UPI003390023A
MAGQKHEPGYNRTAQATLCPGNASRSIYYPGKEAPHDLSGGRYHGDRRLCSVCQPLHKRGGYIHGVPVNAPRKSLIEYSSTLGTTPRSHMCVRNATSHAKFIYDWAPVYETLVFVFD